MVCLPMKKFIACSAALTGGYVYFHHKNWINFWAKSGEESVRCDEVSSYIYLPDNAGNSFEERDYTFERKSNLPLCWKLLQLCKSKDYKIRQKALKSLSKISSLEKWEYIMIAQACDVPTSVSLARYFDTCPYFFLPPPFKDLNQGNVQNDLYNLLLYLPPSNDVHIEKLRRRVVINAKSLLKNVEYSLDLEVGDPSVLFHSQQKKRLVYLFDERILQIFLGYSATSYYRKLMMEKGILKLLLKILRSHDKEPHFQCIIGQILANFALEGEFTETIYMAGWIGILASWIKSSNIIVSLPAAKALANLDKDDVFSSMYDDGVYVLNPVFRQSLTEPIADVIFVHGLRGSTFWTWRQHDSQKKAVNIESRDESQEKSYLNKNFHNYSMCWPKDWLAIDIPLLRIISVDYESSISSWSSMRLEEKEKDYISKNSGELINKLLLSNIGERPIIWIAHSMGGLIVKQILVEASKSEEKKLKMLAEKTCGIVFYSVPHNGSEIASKISAASRILLPSADFSQLEKGSPRLVMLHENFKNIVLNYNIPILSFGETMKTPWGLSSSVLVSLESADPGIGEFYALPVNHLSVCKPVSPSSSDYKRVIQFLRDILSKTNSLEICATNTHKKVLEVSMVLCLIP